jgi:hypothetical protein
MGLILNVCMEQLKYCFDEYNSKDLMRSKKVQTLKNAHPIILCSLLHGENKSIKFAFYLSGRQSRSTRMHSARSRCILTGDSRLNGGG